MNFKCKFCNHKGKIGLLGVDNKDILVFPWYQDNKGLNRYGVYCSKCGTIHNCLISFFRIPLFIPKIIHPYKIVNIITIFDLGMDVSNIMKEYPINCREAAIFVYGLNDLLLDKMRKSKLLGECYDTPLTMDEYQFTSKFK